MRQWKIPITPRSIGFRNRRGVQREKFVRLDAYIEPQDRDVIVSAANELGITISDVTRGIVREAVECGVLTAPFGRVVLRELLPDEPAPQPSS
jgi:hypothetical protein